MIFLSDLDRTLIFSYKRLGDENLCVETKDGKKLSYMTMRSAELFEELSKKVTFIPITTRSKEQYERITFPKGFKPQYAIIDNGANLLVNGTPEPAWRKWSRNCFEAALPELNAAGDFLKNEEKTYFEIRMVDDSFLFTKCYDSDEVMSRMAEVIKPAVTDIFTNGDKLYVIPKEISKHNALERLRTLMKGEKIIAAGDSLFDEEMLSRADIAIIKSGELCGMKLNNIQYAEETGDDPDFTLKTLSQILSEEATV